MCQNTALLESLRDKLTYMKIGFVGGGTGGHFYPLMGVASELSKHESKPELYYFGPSPYDRDSLTKYDIKYVHCPAGKLRRYFSIQNIIDIFRNIFGVPIAIIKLYIIYPDAIFSKGGYTAVPILLAAKFLRIPLVIHESDAVPGRANKLAIGQARYIAISYDDAAQFFPPEKTALTGIPLRPELKDTPENPHEQLGIPEDKPLIYITGGSQGADRVNNLVIKSLKQLLPHYRIYHQTGEANLEEMRLTAQSLLEDTDLMDSYYLEGKIGPKTVNALMSAAKLVVTRAGSTTLFEIAYHGKPAIVIPIPEDVSRDQRTNAYAYARSGAATVLEEQNITTSLLETEINNILTKPDQYENMSKAARGMFVDGASSKIADILVSIGIEHGS
tara:strand:- start:12054 stop:13217 length:1164 start_codon:yes stop_codon:yes gene_type:complete